VVDGGYRCVIVPDDICMRDIMPEMPSASRTLDISQTMSRQARLCLSKKLAAMYQMVNSVSNHEVRCYYRSRHALVRHLA
jgi:hypothetical protein